MSERFTNPESDADQVADEQLVAYLDGELDDETSRQVETLLASNPRLREELGRLEHSWEALETLERADASEKFTRSTLEIVAVAVEQDVEKYQSEAPRRSRRRWLLGGGALAAAALAGFVAVVGFWPDPNRQLIKNFAVLEHLDEYRQIDDIDFLRQLDRRNLFPAPALESLPGDAAGAADAGQTWAERRAAIQDMTPAQKGQLQRNFNRFNDDLSSDEHDRIIHLHEKIENAPYSNELRGVMDRYYAWLKTQSTVDRAGLKDLEPQERIERIEKMQQDEARRNAGRDRRWNERFNRALQGPDGKTLSQRDQESIRQWIDDVAPKYGARYLESVRDSQRRPWDADQTQRDDPAARSGLPGQMFAWYLMRNSGTTPLLTEADLAGLRSRLSHETRRGLEAMPRDEQRAMMVRWVRVLAWREFGPPYGRRCPQDVSNEELAEYLKTLGPEEQIRLLSRPADEMWRLLVDGYTRAKMPDAPAMERDPSRGGPREPFRRGYDGLDGAGPPDEERPPREFPPDDHRRPPHPRDEHDGDSPRPPHGAARP